MNLISLLQDNPIIFALVAGSLIISITIHEFAHALVAYKLGDDTPKYQGRVTLNPLAHLDPLGSLLVLFFGFGWGKPVEYNVSNLDYPKRDTALIAFAGPLSNLLLGITLLIFENIFNTGFLGYVATVNFFLAFFNLIPIYPLDGFNIVLGILPYDLAYKWRELERYSLILLLVLIITNIPGLIVGEITRFFVDIVDNLIKFFI